MPMMQAARSMSALEDRPASLHHSSNKGKKQDASAKPFFIMDWLEDLAGDQDLETIAKALRTPCKQQKDGRDDELSPASPKCTMHDYTTADPTTPKSSNRKNRSESSAFPSSASCPILPGDRSQPLSPVRPKQLFFGVGWGGKKNNSNNEDTAASSMMPPPRRRQPRSPQSIYRKSIALGNAWNAKGLQKAQGGLWQEALSCWDNSLEIRIQMLGRNHFDVANTWNNRGIGLGKLGEFEAALESLEQALEIRWHLWKTEAANAGNTGIGIQSILSTLHNIANVHQQAGQLEEALQVFGQARELGRNHTTSTTSSSSTTTKATTMIPLARICVAMGHVYHQVEQWMDARDAYEDAAHLYRMERQRQSHRQQQQRCASTTSGAKMVVDESAILTCQQELTNVERDLNRLLLLHIPAQQEQEAQQEQRFSDQPHHSSGCSSNSSSSSSKILMLPTPSRSMGEEQQGPCVFFSHHHPHSQHYAQQQQQQQYY